MGMRFKAIRAAQAESMEEDNSHLVIALWDSYHFFIKVRTDLKEDAKKHHLTT